MSSTPMPPALEHASLPRKRLHRAHLEELQGFMAEASLHDLPDLVGVLTAALELAKLRLRTAPVEAIPVGVSPAAVCLSPEAAGKLLGDMPADSVRARLREGLLPGIKLAAGRRGAPKQWLIRAVDLEDHIRREAEQSPYGIRQRVERQRTRRTA